VTFEDTHVRARAAVALAVVAALGIAPYLADSSNGAGWIQALSLLSFIAGISALWVAAAAILGGDHSIRRRLIAFWGASLSSVILIVVFWTAVTFRQGVAELRLPANAVGLLTPPSVLAKQLRTLAECQLRHHNDASFTCMTISTRTTLIKGTVEYLTAPFALWVLVVTAAGAIAGVLVATKRLRERPDTHHDILDSP
jgi:hypothetical protein